MPARKRRFALTYLVQRCGKWHGRFRHVDRLGTEHWPCEVSPCPLDYQLSPAWAAAWRPEWESGHEVALRTGEEELQRPPHGRG